MRLGARFDKVSKKRQIIYICAVTGRSMKYIRKILGLAILKLRRHPPSQEAQSTQNFLENKEITRTFRLRGKMGGPRPTLLTRRNTWTWERLYSFVTDLTRTLARRHGANLCVNNERGGAPTQKRHRLRHENWGHSHRHHA